MFCAQVRPDLQLRLLEERHAPTLFELVEREREYLRDWLPWVDTTKTEDDIVSFIRSSLQQFASNEGFAAGMWHQGRLAGVIGTHKIEWLYRKAELGYWLAREFQGNGIVTDSTRVAVTHLLAELDLNRIEIHCATGNLKSCAIPERLGFTLEGTRREAQLLNGRFQDLFLYAMLKRDWKT